MTRSWKDRRYTRNHVFYGLLVAGAIGTALAVISFYGALLAVTEPAVRRGGDLLLVSCFCVVAAAVALSLAAHIHILARRYNAIATALHYYSLRLTTFKIARMVGTLALLPAIGGLLYLLLASTDAAAARGIVISVASLIVAGVAIVVATASVAMRPKTCLAKDDGRRRVSMTST